MVLHYYIPEQALAKASPLSVRRIQNKIPDAATKRYSASHADSLGSIHKLVNRVGSATLAHSDSSRGHLHSSDSNINATSQGQGGEGDVKKRVVRHNYEDVEVVGQKEELDPERSKSNSRTMNWINHHTELNWGRGDGTREITGSMWSSRNRVQRQHSKEKVRNGSGMRRLVQTKSDQGRELVGTYQGPARHYRQQQQQQAASAVLQPHPQATSKAQDDRGQPQLLLERGGVTLRTQGQGTAEKQQNRSRRISYVTAMNDPTVLPVRDKASPTSFIRTRDEQFSSSEFNVSGLSSYSTGAGSSRHLEGYAAQSSHLYSHPGPVPAHSAHPMMQHRPDKYSSLREVTTANPPLTRRRTSDSSEPSMDRGGRGPQYYHHGRGPLLQGHQPYRTFSNERTFSNNSPPQREHAHSHTSMHAAADMLHATPPPPPPPHAHSRRTTQVESYL